MTTYTVDSLVGVARAQISDRKKKHLRLGWGARDDCVRRATARTMACECPAVSRGVSVCSVRQCRGRGAPREVPLRGLLGEDEGTLLSQYGNQKKGVATADRTRDLQISEIVTTEETYGSSVWRSPN